ncbi:MAG: DUF86 domain-containing protein [Erysipelotrichales bacterium]|nr:DUF86 domain-containing protein [Erysipelotrichales bacterium]
MDRKKDDLYYAGRIQKDLEFILQHTENVNYEEFAENEILRDAMCFRLIQISENAGRLQDTYKKNHPLIPWTDITGLRNRIVHNYGNVDFHIVYETLTRDIPVLNTLLKTE